MEKELNNGDGTNEERSDEEKEKRIFRFEVFGDDGDDEEVDDYYEQIGKHKGENKKFTV